MKKIIQILSVLIILWVSSYFHLYNNFEKNIIINENKIIKIEPWEIVEDLAIKLDISSHFTKKYIEKNKPEFELLVWKFELKKNSNIKDILESLEVPLPEDAIDITILEWWNIYDIDSYLSNKWLILSWEYIKYTENSEKIEALSWEWFFPKFIYKDLISLEWYLYPDTYSLRTPLKINELVIKQLNNFEKKVYDKLFENKNLSKQIIYDVINLAAIVEKEEKNPNEKSTVAWILKKRLQNDWKIWADITVCYPHELTANECKMVVSKYIREESEYNTRTMIWLPKTPIWNPNFETINATLNDNKTKYWFYLHNVKTWEIHYAETNAGHEENKKYMY